MSSPKVIKAPDVMIRQVGNESVILDLKTERYLGLDDVATRMWVALVESQSVEEAYGKLLGVYRVEPEELRRDLDQLVEELLGHGLIRLEQNSAV